MKSILLWGVPVGANIVGICRSFEAVAAKCNCLMPSHWNVEWEGRKDARFVRVLFESSTTRDTVYDQCAAELKRVQGWNVVKGRPLAVWKLLRKSIPKKAPALHQPRQAREGSAGGSVGRRPEQRNPRTRSARK